MTPALIDYKDEKFICYKIVDRRCRLMYLNGLKYSGTPDLENVDFVETFMTKEFNNNKYFQFKNKVYSVSTGNEVKHSQDLNLFK